MRNKLLIVTIITFILLCLFLKLDKLLIISGKNIAECHFKYAAAYNFVKENKFKIYPKAGACRDLKKIIFKKNIENFIFPKSKFLDFFIDNQLSIIFSKNLTPDNIFIFKQKFRDKIFKKIYILEGNFNSEDFFIKYKSELLKNIYENSSKNYDYYDENSYCLIDKKNKQTGYIQAIIDILRLLHNKQNIKAINLGDIKYLDKLFIDKILKCKNFIVQDDLDWWYGYLAQNSNLTIFLPHTIKQENSPYDIENTSNRIDYPKSWIQISYNLNQLKKIYQQHDIENNLADYKIFDGDGEELSIKSNKLVYLDKYPTIVTAYYNVKSKFLHEEYINWIKNFMKIPYNLIVFTDKENYQLIKKLRGKLPIKIVVREINELYHYKYISEYMNFNNIDQNKKHTIPLYIIWAEKIKFVNDAIKFNPFNSKYFAWIDIGVFRESGYFDFSFKNNKFFVEDQISILQILPFKINELKQKSIYDNQSIRIAGGYMFGNINSWKLYNKLWDENFKNLLKTNKLFGNDQIMIANIILKNPELFNIIHPPGNYVGNKWWYPIAEINNKNFRFN